MPVVNVNQDVCVFRADGKCESLPRKVFMCCTAMRRTVSLSSLRDMALHVGTNEASSSIKLFILSLRLFSIWLWASLEGEQNKPKLKKINFLKHDYKTVRILKIEILNMFFCVCLMKISIKFIYLLEVGPPLIFRPVVFLPGVFYPALLVISEIKAISCKFIWIKINK